MQEGKRQKKKNTGKNKIALECTDFRGHVWIGERKWRLYVFFSKFPILNMKGNYMFFHELRAPCFCWLILSLKLDVANTIRCNAHLNG